MTDETTAKQTAGETGTFPMPGGFNGQMPDIGAMPEEFDPSQMPGGFGGPIPEGNDLLPLTSEAPVQPTDGVETESSDTPGETESPESNNRSSRMNMQMPAGNFSFNMNEIDNTANWIWLAVSAVLLCIGLLVAKLYKRY